MKEPPASFDCLVIHGVVFQPMKPKLQVNRFALFLSQSTTSRDFVLMTLGVTVGGSNATVTAAATAKLPLILARFLHCLPKEAVAASFLAKRHDDCD